MRNSTFFILVFTFTQFLVNSLYGQVGRVGINTTTPAAMLHVKDSSVVFTGAYPNPGSPGNPPLSGQGTRMMWYPAKAAFRVGGVYGTQWDKDSIGIFSVAMGVHTKASGQYTLAVGEETTARGRSSTAFGGFTNAFGSYSTALGNTTKAGGIGSMATGSMTNAKGDYSTSIGNQTYARSFASFILGQFNDTSSISSTSWLGSDPAFIIGNGASLNSRGNAFTVLKNGRTGISTFDPQSMLHIVKSGTSGGPFNSNATTIIESNQHSYIQFSQTNGTESGLLSGNNLTAIRSALLFGADSTVMFRTGGNITRAIISNTGNVGIGTTTPQKKLHVSNGASGAVPVSTAVAVFEDNTNMTINLLSPNANSSAIEFGNVSSAVHGGIIYNHATVLNGLSFRTNGNTTKMAITDVGDVGIGTTIPGAKLDVNGTSKLGANGTVLTEVIKVTISKDVGSVSANSALIVDYVVANCITTSTVFVSPEMDLADGLIIAYARVSAAGTVRVNFSNTTGVSINPPSMNYYITVIR